MGAASIQVSWWCSGAVGKPWDWTYTPFLGVWVIAGVMIATRWLLISLLKPLPSTGFPNIDAAGVTHAKPPTTRSNNIRFAIAVLAFIAVSEWPLGQLGAGYLLSVAVVRFMVYLMVVAPNLIRGVPGWVWESLLCTNPTVERIMTFITKWQVAFGISQIVFLITMYPPVVDAIKVYQVGSFLMDMVWLAVMMIYWWPVLSPVDRLPRLHDPWQVLYLFGMNMVMVIPAVYFVYAKLPVFVLYELAPPVFLGYDVLYDQRGGGIIMKLIMMVVLWPLMTIYFMRWANREERVDYGVATEKDIERMADEAASRAVHYAKDSAPPAVASTDTKIPPKV